MWVRLGDVLEELLKVLPQGAGGLVSGQSDNDSSAERSDDLVSPLELPDDRNG